jgi:hypothetical protein
MPTQPSQTYTVLSASCVRSEEAPYTDVKTDMNKERTRTSGIHQGFPQIDLNLLGLEKWPACSPSSREEPGMDDMMEELEVIVQRDTRNGSNHVDYTHQTENTGVRLVGIDRTKVFPQQHTLRSTGPKQDHGRLGEQSQMSAALPMERWRCELDGEQMWHGLAQVRLNEHAGTGIAPDARVTVDEGWSVIPQKSTTYYVEEAWDTGVAE